MKRVLSIVLAVLFVAGISAPVWAVEHHKGALTAAPKTEITRGEVVSIDATTNTLVVKTKSGTQKTFKVDAKVAGEVKAGDKVKVKSAPGSDVADSVKVMKDEPKKDESKKK